MKRITHPLIAATTTTLWLTCALFAGPAPQDQPTVAVPTARPKVTLKQKAQTDVTKPGAIGKARRLPAAAPAVVRDVVVMNNLDIRLNQALRPFYYSRLIHARNVLHLSRDQLQRIRPETDKAFKGFLVAAALEQQRLGQQLMDQALVRKASGLAPDALAEFESVIAKIVKQQVDPALWPKYDAELAERNVANKEASLQLLMNALDQDLFLSPEQREKLSVALAEQWNNTWNASLQLLFNGNDYRPNIPDGLIVPILNAEQREVWKSKRKYQGRAYPTVTVPIVDEPRLDRELGGGDAALDGGVKPGNRKAVPSSGRTGTTRNVTGDQSHVS